MNVLKILMVTLLSLSIVSCHEENTVTTGSDEKPTGEQTRNSLTVGHNKLHFIEIDGMEFMIIDKQSSGGSDVINLTLQKAQLEDLKNKNTNK